MMKRHLTLSVLYIFLFSPVHGQIISQYIETSAGTTPKGIEIWNNTASDLNFGSNNLVIEKGTNGAIPSADFIINTGTLQAGKVIVLGSSDMQTVTESNGSIFFLKAFTFNGNDALIIKYGGTITDVLGISGMDPGTAWTGNGVSTANQNISIKMGVLIGDTDGWTDPSTRFETKSTDNSLTDFGIAPLPPTPSITVSLSSLSGFKYLINKGPSIGKPVTVSGVWLSENIAITPPANYEISIDNISFQSTAINLAPSGGTVLNTAIYARLKTGLAEGSYSGNINLTSVGVTDKTVSCSGFVSPVPNAWINEFHYDNNGTDVNEFVEIVIENAPEYDLSDFILSLYNGGNGTVYNTQTSNNFTAGQLLNGYSFFTWILSSMQNGPDGLSLNYLDSTLDFISYEGVFVATDGPETGYFSKKINFAEGSSTSVGHSLQLWGVGYMCSHFMWNAQPETPGFVNAFQMFGAYNPPVPVDYRIVIFLFLLILSGKLLVKKKKGYTTIFQRK